MTQQGLEALAEMRGRITGVAAYAGNGTADELIGQTGLVSVKQELHVIEDGLLGNKRWFRLQLSSKGLKSGYTLNQLGLFICIDNGPLFMYLIAQSEAGDAIPSESTAPDFLAEYTLPVVFSTEQSYDAPLSSECYITPDALTARLLSFKQDLTGEIGSREIISDTEPTEPYDTWLKPMGGVSIADVFGSGSAAPLYLSGVHIGMEPPEDKTQMWRKPLSE